MFNWLKPKYEPTEEDKNRVIQFKLNSEAVKKTLGYDPKNVNITVIIADLCRQIEALKEEVNNK